MKFSHAVNHPVECIFRREHSASEMESAVLLTKSGALILIVSSTQCRQAVTYRNDNNSSSVKQRQTIKCVCSFACRSRCLHGFCWQTNLGKHIHCSCSSSECGNQSSDHKPSGWLQVTPSIVRNASVNLIARRFNEARIPSRSAVYCGKDSSPSCGGFATKPVCTE